MITNPEPPKSLISTLSCLLRFLENQLRTSHPLTSHSRGKRKIEHRREDEREGLSGAQGRGPGCVGCGRLSARHDMKLLYQAFLLRQVSRMIIFLNFAKEELQAPCLHNHITWNLRGQYPTPQLMAQRIRSSISSWILPSTDTYPKSFQILVRPV